MVFNEQFWRGPPVGEWRLGAPHRAYENAWIGVDHHEAVAPSGAVGPYGIVRFKKLAVGVAPIDGQGFLHLVGQWRVPLGRYSWEIPEGGAEPGEDPRAAAARELEEEAGVRAGTLVEILRMDLSNSVSDEQSIIFLGTDLTGGVFAPDPTEALHQARVPFRQALAAADAGWIRDSLTVAALFKISHMAHVGRLEPALAKLLIEG